MSDYSSDDILQAVLKLRPFWQRLLDDNGATAAESLVRAAQGDEGDARHAVNLLLDLFEQHSATDTLRQQIDAGALAYGEPIRTYDPLAGRIGPMATTGIVYRCPVEACHVTWRPQMAGQRIPHCPEHGQLLTPK